MRLIDADKIIFREIDEIGGEYEPYLGCSKSQIDNLPTVQAIPVTEKAFEMFEADYKNRLKADLEAILVELQLEIEEHEESIIGHYGKETKEKDFPSHKIERNTGRKECIDLIQEKINELKAESEE
jgi:hypothetical protein